MFRDSMGGVVQAFLVTLCDYSAYRLMSTNIRKDGEERKSMGSAWNTAAEGVY